ncbi:MAG TPA: delta-60 repeat domain-containing protein, partial [Dongiaceae bacterium]|nr:delta-60 repeat domain-containing protein [Dongiaceae bacterium]
MTRLGNLFNPKIHSLIRLLFVALLVGGMLSQSFGQLSLADSSFHVGPGTQSPRFADNCVNSIVVLADGRILVGGIFTGIAGVARTNLACLNHDGTPDLTFPGTANGPVQKLLVQSDGKILIGGSFSNLQGTACLNLGRLLTNGLVDPDFDAGTNFADMDGIYDLARQTNGSVVVSSFYQPDPMYAEYGSTLRRLEPDGHLDDSFNNTNLFLYWTAQCLLIRTNGEILVGGGFSYVNNARHTAFAVFDAAGNLKTNYTDLLLPESDVFSLNELPDGSLLLGG